MAQTGRPLKFKDNEELSNKIDEYFLMCIDPEDDSKWRRPPTITGLAYYLDTTRETLLDYQEKDGFSDTIKKAKLKIHAFNEEQLYRNTQVTGVIFNLKNNYDWKDKNETELSNPDGNLKTIVINKHGSDDRPTTETD